MRTVLFWSLLLGSLLTAAQPVAVGEQLPTIFFTHVINAPSATVSISSKGGKPLLIGFWNTHCPVGKRFLPSLAAIQQQVGPALQIMLVTSEEGAVVQRALTDLSRLQGIRIPIAVEDTLFKKHFPHVVEPHFVWVDAGGVVQGITGHEVVELETVWRFTEGAEVVLPLKKDIMDKNILYSITPLLLNQYEETKSGMAYTSYLGAYRSGVVSFIRAALYDKRDSTVRIVAVNQPPHRLYQVAYGKFNNFHRARFVQDTLLDDFRKGDKSLLFCYDLLLKDTSRRKAYTWMRQDLDRAFGVRSSLESRKINVYVLKRTKSNRTIPVKANRTPDVYPEGDQLLFQHVTLRTIVENHLNERSLLSLPVIDETGYEGFVDLAISADFGDVEAVRRSFQHYGLDLVREEREMEVIVIKQGNNPA